MTSAGAVEVRQVELDHVDAGKRRAQRGDTRRVRPVAAADQERPLVEPEQVAALGGRRRLERRGDGNPEPRQVVDGCRRLGDGAGPCPAAATITPRSETIAGSKV